VREPSPDQGHTCAGGLFHLLDEVDCGGLQLVEAVSVSVSYVQVVGERESNVGVVELLKDPEMELTGSSAAGVEVRICPGCGEGTLVMRKGRYGEFLGCSRFPKCCQTGKI
jgi:ssDNA-binding Zn-finger/Zn-ribbon topoisomerase 1